MGINLFSMANCGKDGAIVAKRLASLNGGVASTRVKTMKIDRVVFGSAHGASIVNGLSVRVWEKYLHFNGVDIRGMSLNPYS